MQSHFSDVPLTENQILKINKNEYLIKCASCNKDLIRIHSTPDVPMKTKVKSNCPYCNDESYFVNVEGKYFIESLGHSILENNNGEIKICL